MASFSTGQAMINNLLLDVANPRHAKAKSQKDAIIKVLEEQRDKLAKLCESIVAQGGLSPMDRLLVMSNNGTNDFTVLEGNRRIAALKVLSNPSLMDDAKISKAVRDKIDQLSTKFKKSTVEPLDIAIVKKRSDAKYWINLRHTGANGGAGVVQWASNQQERFQGPSPQLDVIEFVRNFGQLSEYEVGKLDGRYITTLRRLIESPDVRALVGVDKVGKTLFSNIEAREVMKPLKRIVLDLALKKVKVDDLKTVDQMKLYVSGFSTNDSPNLSKKIPSKPIRDFTQKDFGSSSAASSNSNSSSQNAGSGASPSPSGSSKRTGIVPAGTHLKIGVPRIKKIYEELRILRYSRHINAIGVLFRVFLETSVDAYLQKIGKGTKDSKGKFKSLIVKANEVITDIVNNHGGDNKVFNPLRHALASPASPLWVDLLHSYVHNAGGTPTKVSLEAAWDHAEPLLKAIWK